jgi:RNA polymerase sigma-70 factor (ECF subfamily)
MATPSTHAVHAERPNPELWLDRHGDFLYAFAMMRLRDPVLAEDAVQETLLAALKGTDRFAGQSAERTWLVGILKHKIVDQFRRSSRETPADLSREDAFEHPEFFRSPNEEWTGHWKLEVAPVEWERTPAGTLEKAEFWKVIEGCLAELPARLAVAFTLREIDDLSTTEICALLGVTTNNLWVMLHRARIHLRACVEQHWFRTNERGH